MKAEGIRALAEAALRDDKAATPGPWTLAWPVCVPNGQPDDIDVHYGVAGPSDGESWPIGYEEDAALIAAARTREPRLAEYVLAVEDALDKLRADAEFSDNMTQDGDRSREYRRPISFVDSIRAAIARNLERK